MFGCCCKAYNLTGGGVYSGTSLIDLTSDMFAFLPSDTA